MQGTKFSQQTLRATFPPKVLCMYLQLQRSKLLLSFLPDCKLAHFQGMGQHLLWTVTGGGPISMHAPLVGLLAMYMASCMVLFCER